MSERRYIQVVVPVKLEWCPWYYSDTALERGTRVRVRLGRNVYIGFVLNEGGEPDIDPKRIQPLIGVESQLERISDDEIKLWHFIADYYLCTIGEVFKAAYPALRVNAESKTARTGKSSLTDCAEGKHKKLNDADKKAVTEILDAFDNRKTALLHGSDRNRIYDELTRRTLTEGKDVLVLSPGSDRMSSTARRDVAKLLRSDKPVVVRASRTAIFLPFHKLGLVIIDEEQDVTYKQDSPAPRYNARDVALVLAQLQNANVVLGSSAPSLESFFNVSTGKYHYVRLSSNTEQTAGIGEMRSTDIAENNFLLIDTDAEKRKNGMVGELSRVLICEKEAAESLKKKVLVVNSWELGNISKMKLDKYAFVAVLHFEFLFSRPDFRADEKAWQTLEKLKSATKGRLVVQTSNASHPIFSGNVERMMEERKAVGLPPYTRQIVARGRDGEILKQAFLAKDSNLAQTKKRFLQESSSMPGFTTVDVDPV